MKTTLIALLGLACMFARAKETNLFFVTDDGSLIHVRNGQIKMNPRKVEEAKNLSESLPASQYPEGNWGNAQGGFQLSLRFEKKSFTNSEPILATILLRNVTNQTLIYPVVDQFGKDGPINLTAIDKRGNALSPESDEICFISAHDDKLFPGTQKKFIEQLSQWNFGTNTSFSVYASITVTCPHCVTLESLRVPIKIGVVTN